MHGPPRPLSISVGFQLPIRTFSSGPAPGAHQRLEVMNDAADPGGIVNEDAEFEIVGESFVGEVRAAEQSHTLVGGDQFCVQCGSGRPYDWSALARPGRLRPGGTA